MTDALNSRVARFEQNEANVDTWAKGDATTSVDFGGGPVRSPAKLIADLDRAITDETAGLLTLAQQAAAAAVESSQSAMQYAKESADSADRSEAALFDAVKASELADPTKGVSMVAHAVDDRVLSDHGASMVGVTYTDPDAVRQPLIQVIEEHFTVTRYGANPSGDGFSTDAFKKALAKVTQIAQNLGVTRVPAIEVPSGLYKCDDTLPFAPWHKFVSLGNVELNFEALDLGKDGIVLRNDQTAIPEGDAKGASMVPFLNAGHGSIFVKGPGKATAQGWGIRVGDTTNAGNIRDTGGEGVIVSGWRGALRYDPINTYLLTWTKCRFEQNREENIYVSSDTPVINSGEKMLFRDCVLSAAYHALYHNCDGFMYEFDGCSIDYHDIPFKIDALGRYTRFLFVGGHSEAFEGLWFDATTSGARVELALVGHEILTTKRYVSATSGATVRTIIDGNASNRMRLTGDDNALRYTVRPYLPDTPLIGDNVLIHGLSGTIQEGNYAMLSRSRLLLRDGAFTVNAIGTSGTALTHWVRDQGAITDVSTTDIQSIDALGQSLHLVGTSTNSTATFHSADTLAVKPGEIYGLGSDVYGAGTTGDLNVRVFLRFYDYTGAQVGDDAGLTYKMSDAYADAAVPNQSLGRVRAMCSDSGIQTVPRFATTAKVYFTVSAFVGDVYIKNIRVFNA
ncbi:hypothetical protein C7401_12673 [Paraburkholderia unamae]|uniref:hypothetical protein n=1 Tax=Paraburkholderia unamae TaxID=219649 RepID=UPI000DC2B1AE|nr:hypothetical protein [Paraburkholderia unamae]RAR53899.1 hypothetical protein C7401_12673 [Paraburkholderia unamae]